MAAQGSESIILKLLTDKENNKVVMAETNSDFVDILYSFLTMPIGTIVRLISKQPHPVTFGSLNSLYKWVESLEEQLLETQSCKSMLLLPRNPYQKECRKLKLNIDDTEPTKCYINDTEPIKYYICDDWNCSGGIVIRCGGGLYTTYKNVICKCKKMMNREIRMAKEDEDARSEGDGGVFVCGTTKFMVTDDL